VVRSVRIRVEDALLGDGPEERPVVRDALVDGDAGVDVRQGEKIRDARALVASAAVLDEAGLHRLLEHLAVGRELRPAGSAHGAAFAAGAAVAAGGRGGGGAAGAGVTVARATRGRQAPQRERREGSEHRRSDRRDTGPPRRIGSKRTHHTIVFRDEDREQQVNRVRSLHTSGHAVRRGTLRFPWIF
jgi:hypothetical protein